MLIIDKKYVITQSKYLTIVPRTPLIFARPLALRLPVNILALQSPYIALSWPYSSSIIDVLEILVT